MSTAETTNKRTNNHEEIEQWVKDRDGKPAIVGGTKRGESGVLRIDFGEPDQSLEEISWEQFFTIFDDNNLTFLYQETTTSGKPSHFNKFVARDDEEQKDEGNADDKETQEEEAEEPVKETKTKTTNTSTKRKEKDPKEKKVPQ